MEKLILKRITLMIMAIFIFIFLVGSTSIVIFKNKSMDKDITGMISEIENTYKENKINIELTKEFFEDDYFNRAYAVDYIIHNNPEENLNNESLKKIEELMEVESIHIVDKNGVIVLSSDDESIGLNLLNSKQTYPFWNLINGKDDDGKVIQLNAVSISTKEEKIYVGVESSLPEYSLVQIGLDREVFNNLVKMYSMEYMVSNTPTIYEKTIFAVNKDTGALCGITKNNEQDIVIEDIDNNEDLKEKLSEVTNGKILKINNEYRYIKTKILDDYIIGAHIELSSEYNILILDLIFLGLGMLIAFALIIRIVKVSIKKYMLKDMISIEKNIEELISGNYDVKFNTEYDTELKGISYVLNHWKDSYKYKDERMSRIMSAINTHSAIFECLYVINKNFFSDNIQEILGLTNEVWSDISKTPDNFEKYIESLEVKDGIVRTNNKFLKIVSFKKEDEFYGMIVDKTNDEEVKSKIKKESETDVLTNLLNRKGLESRIKNIFKENKEGALIIFDLDNFKRVNDELGHPVGDEVLKIFSNCLVSSFRKNDIISRLGGDEFVVFINKNIKVDILSKKLNELLDKIRKDLKFYYDNYGLSTSVGVAYRNEKNNTYENLYIEADEALYKSKKLGKDRFYISITEE